MIKMIFRRLILGILTLVLISGFVFTAIETLPGDSCTAYLGRMAQGTRLDNCREEFGLNRPAIVRYADWAINATQGDFGISIKRKKPVSEILLPRLRNTLILGGAAALIGVPISILLGLLCGLRRDRKADIAISTGAIFAMTVPEFVTATIMVLIFSVWLQWFPGIVITQPDAPISEFLLGIILPIISLSLVMTAHILRMVRTTVIEVLASDFVQMAYLKGAPYWRIVFFHVLPSALLPTINLVAMTIAWLLGGVVVIEVVFNYPGLGRLMVDAVSDRDITMVQAIALILAAIYVSLNLVADLLVLVANPRLRTMKI